ncbi:MAG TPA: class I SAM-dependent methyltransferase [Phycisphaerae bacterium]|nr:class I SAM-dependent methyltransferase [Phycisphaerae bacterium]
MSVFGRDFAAVYNDRWAFWGLKMWPFLAGVVAKEVPRAETWLDLCCGTGSLLRLVCENGFVVTGVDASRHQVAHARRNAPSARVIVQDIRELSLSREFDVVTCMFDSLNYLTRKQDLLRAFGKTKRHLSHSGRFAFDMNTFEGLQDQWCKTSVTHERDLTLLMESSFDASRAIGRCLITGFIRKGRSYRRFQEEHVERGYRAREIEDLLDQAGFSFRKLDGHSFGRPKKRSARLLYVCKRKKAPAKAARRRL